MKTIAIGATGTIGSAVVRQLEVRGHEVVRAARRGPVRVDLEDTASVEALFASVRDVDAVICCAASGRLTPLDSPSDDDFTAGLQGKLLGQVHLVRRALPRLRDRSVIVLTSGVFEKPTPGGAFGALVNAGLDAFARAAAVDCPAACAWPPSAPDGSPKPSPQRVWTRPKAPPPPRWPASTSHTSTPAHREARNGERPRVSGSAASPHAPRPASPSRALHRPLTESRSPPPSEPTTLDR
ncbi:SDR family oxidoreductase [Streptomyces decoyicus]